MLLGVHCSVGGGLEHAFDEAASLDIDTFQIFTRNQRQWRAKPVSEEEGNTFKDTWKKHSKVKIIFSHASYLINLASVNKSLQEQSITAFTDEVRRCHALGLSYTVLHPGAAIGSTENEALKRIGEALKRVIEATHGSEVKILLENTAGQGTHVGYKFEHLATIMEDIGSERIGTCFDTCHAFAAGYDIRNADGFHSVFEDFDRIIGLKHLHALHLNDSKNELGSRVDRHEHIGKGKIGALAFGFFMKKFNHLPKVIETDKDDNMDKVNLELLRELEKS